MSRYISVLESEIYPIEFNSLKSGMSEQSDFKKIRLTCQIELNSLKPGFSEQIDLQQKDWRVKLYLMV